VHVRGGAEQRCLLLHISPIFLSFFLLFPCHTQEHFSPVFLEANEMSVRVRDWVRWAVNQVVHWLSKSSLQVANDRKLFSLTWNQFPEFLGSKTFKDKKFKAHQPSCSFKPGKVCEIFPFLFPRNRYSHVTVCLVLLWLLR